MKTDQLKKELEEIKALLRARGIAPKQDKTSGVTMPHTLWMCEHALDVLLPQGINDLAHQYLGFCQRALLGFGVYDFREVTKATPSLLEYFGDKNDRKGNTS